MLATISIQAFTGSGLFQRATDAKEQAKLAELEEQMNLAITEMIANKNGKKFTVDEYITHLKEKEKLNITDQDEDEENGKQIIVVEDKYVLRETQIDGTNKYTYTGLEQNKKYNIKIVAIAKNEQNDEILVDRTTGSVTGLTTSNTTFSYSPVQGTWTNGSVTATVSTTVEGYTLQTSKDGTTWDSTATQTFTTNGTVYARLCDGINVGGYTSATINNIDVDAPKINYSNEEKVNINTTINETYIKNKYTITDVSNTSIINIVVKNSSGSSVGTTLNVYDIYSVTYSVKDEAGNTTNVNQTYITKPTGSMTLTNVLPNASFESDIDTYFNGTIGRTTSMKRSGSYSMYYSCSNSQAFPIICYGDIGMQSKKIYVRGYGRATNSAFTPYIYVYEASSPNLTWTRSERGQVSKGNSSSTNWSMLSILTVPSSSNYKYLQLQIAQGNTVGTGTIYWDDFMALILDSSIWSSTPTKIWLDRMIPYFTGTTTISSW